MRDLITVAEAAALLGYHPASVQKLFAAGKLGGERVNARLILLDRASVEAYLPCRRRPGNPNWRKKGEDDAE